MVARLPGELSLEAPRGRRPGPPDTDFRALAAGVGQAIGTLGAEIAAYHDDQAADAMLGFQADFQTRAAERAAAYDGTQPGFALGEADAWDREWRTFEESLPRNQRRFARERADQAKAAYVSQAIGVESQRRGGIVAERQRAVDVTSLAGGQLAYGAKRNEIEAAYDAFDGADPETFLLDVGARTEAALTAGREAVPERLRPSYDAWAAQERVKEMARAQAAVDDRQDGLLFRGVSDTVREATNQVLDAPDRYEANAEILNMALDSLPAPVRDKVAPGAREELVVARLQGLSARGDREAAKRELASGRYDRVLSPGTKARLMAGMDRETTADVLRQQDVQDRAASDIAATATTGVNPGNTSVAEIEQNLGPTAAASYMRQTERARELYGAVGPLHELSLSDIDARVAQARPDPKSPGYAQELETYEALQKAAAAEKQRRAADPAAWAMSAGEGSASSDFLRKKFDGWSAEEDPARKAAAAREYGRATLARQEQAGVPPAARRVLPKSVSGNWAAGVNSEDEKTRRNALRGVGLMVLQFGPYGRRVGDELVASGVSRRDLEAAVSAIEAGEPALLESYAFGSGQRGADKALKGGDEKRLKERVDRRMERYLLTLAPLDPRGDNGAAALDSVMADARGRVLKGASVDEAVDAAFKRYDRYDYRRGFRVPRGVTGGDSARLNAMDRGAVAVRAGVTAEDGKWLTAPPDPRTGRPMPGGAYARMVRERGTWITLSDDSGVQLMIDTPNGYKLVLDNKGRPIRRRWDELETRGRQAPGGRARWKPFPAG
jgi:hypothetical protein